MTENLKTLMDRAADVEFAAVDLDAVTAVGDREVRRRRITGGVAAGVGLALVAGGAVLVAGHEDADREGQVASETAPVDAVTWTWDGTLHSPEQAYPLGHPVAAYVRTSAGYAFTDGQGGVFSYVDGSVAEIGTIAARHPRLVADPEGSLVGWVDPTADAPTFVVTDLDSGFTTDFGSGAVGMGQLADESDPFYFYALDGRTAYVRDTRGAVAVDVDTGDSVVVDPRARNGFDIVAAGGGLVAFQGDDGLRVGATPDSAEPLVGAYGSAAVFSPGARWISVDADEPAIYDVRTGELVPVDVDGRVFATGFEWLDADTLVMIASRTTEGPAELLTCEIPAGDCVVAEPDLGDFDEIEGRLAFATGTTLE